MTSQTLTARPVASVWRAPLLAFIALLAVLLGLCYATAEAMVQIWLRSETFTHAFVVPPIVLWLVWRQRDALRLLTPRPCGWALLPLAGAAAAWLLGSLVWANSVSQLAFTAMLVLAVPVVLGVQVTRALAFPLAFLFFAVPVGEFLTPMMMQWTADFTVMALRASGIPVYREGLQFVIPSGNWSVVEACSGIRYLMASFMVGSLFAYLNYTSIRRRLAFVAVSLAVPILANWLRAYLIVMLGHLSDNKIATGVDHLVYGWAFFGVVILTMFFIGARWAEPPLAPPPVGTRGGTLPASQLRPGWVALAAMIVALAPHLWLQRVAGPASTPAPALALPDTLAPGWVASALPLTSWRPVYADASVQASTTYASPAGSVGLIVAYYRDQTASRKLVSSSNVLVRADDPLWNALRSGQVEVSIAARQLSIRSAELLEAVQPGKAERQRLHVWQFYWVGGRLTSSDVMAKIWGAWQRLIGQGDESAAVVLVAVENAPGPAGPLLESFVRANVVNIEQRLQAVQQARR